MTTNTKQTVFAMMAVASVFALLVSALPPVAAHHSPTSADFIGTTGSPAPFYPGPVICNNNANGHTGIGGVCLSNPLAVDGGPTMRIAFDFSVANPLESIQWLQNLYFSVQCASVSGQPFGDKVLGTYLSDPAGAVSTFIDTSTTSASGEHCVHLLVGVFVPLPWQGVPFGTVTAVFCEPYSDDSSLCRLE